MLLKIAQTFSNQASTAMFLPGFMATCCHTKPLLAVSKASPTVRTNENRTLNQVNHEQLLYFKQIAMLL